MFHAEDFSSGNFVYYDTTTTDGKSWYHKFYGDEPNGGYRDLPQTGGVQLPILVSGGHLQVAVGNTSGGVKDKTEFRLAHGDLDADCPKFDQTRKFRFRFKIKNGSSPPNNWVYISQLYQRGIESPVPFVLKLVPDGSSNYALTCVASSQAERYEPANAFRKGIKTETWYHVHITFRPSYDGLARMGYLKIETGEEKSTGLVMSTGVERHLRMGTAPVSGGARNAFDIRIGIYRAASNRSLKIQYDDFWYGD